MSQSLESESQGNQLSAEGAATDTEPISAVQSSPLHSQPAGLLEELRLDILADDSAEQKSIGGSETAAMSPVSQSDTSSGSLDRSAGSSKMSTRAAAGGALAGVRRQDSFYESDEDSRTPRSRRKSPGSHVKPDVERPPGYESAIGSEEASPSREVESNHIRHHQERSPSPSPVQGSSSSTPSPPERVKQQEMRTTVVTNSDQPLPSYEEALSAMTEPTTASAAPAAPIAKLDSTGSDSEQVNLTYSSITLLSLVLNHYPVLVVRT